MKLHDVVTASEDVAGTSGRLDKIERLATLLAAAARDEVALVTAWLMGTLPQGRIGVGPAVIRAAMPATAAPAPTLDVADVHAAFEAVAKVEGKGAVETRRQHLHDLFSRATTAEQRFLAALLFGELRQGAQAGVMLDAIARAADVPLRAVRRAAMLAGDPAAIAAAALEGGRAALGTFALRVGQPVQPMLAQSADSVEDALAALGEAALEFKLDGARIQVHRSGADVRVFTRRLHDVTGSVPEIVDAVRRLPAQSLVLDGEAIALRADGTPLPFQQTMSRFGTKSDVRSARDAVPLHCFFFDCLHVDGEALIDADARTRWAGLESAVPAAMRVERTVTADVGAARAFLDSAIAGGHEGIMAKALDASYETGARGRAWVKVKPARTLDLVVLAAEWGHGRRTGYLSNLHLGARDPRGGFVMLGKTFKGLTDDLLAWQTRELLAREVSRDRYTVHVRPELVVEIAFNEVQASPRYPGGVALRFARVKGYRPDKAPDDADTIDTVRAIHSATGVARAMDTD